MKSAATQQRKIWIGMVEVRSFEDSTLLKDVLGAFVHVLTWAANKEEFGRKARELMEDLHLELVDIEGAEPLENRGPEDALDPEIAQIAAEVRDNPQAIRYGPFHMWAGPTQ